MATRQIAQGLAGLGRYGDSMLMHVSPAEVAGIQHLGKMHGVSLTTNPHTGLPEAFSFGNFLKTMAPTIAGVVAAPFTAGTSLALLGPVMAGAATGAGIAAASGDNVLSGGLMGGLGGYGGGQLGAGLSGMGAAAPTAQGVGTTTLNAAPGVVGETVASATPDLVAAATPEMANQTAANIAQYGAMDGGMAAHPTFESMGQGLRNIGQEGSWDAFTAGMGGTGAPVSDTRALMGIGMPLGASYLAGNMPTMEQPDKDKDKYDPNKSLNLSGDTGLRLAGGGITSLYGSQDGTQAQNTLNENYGLGRLNDLSNANAIEQAKFNSNGYAAPAQQPYGGAQYNPPTMNQQAMQMNQQPQMGQVQQMGGFGGFNSMGPQNAFTPQPRFAKGGLADGGFVVPADVVSHLGNGSTDAGLKHLHRSMGAKAIRGAGDGMSDSIKTTIEGRQPARIADGEAYIPPEVVKQRGGAKNLYNMMNKVRKSRTGTTKQGKQINPNKYTP